jgi:hypothetical protein
MKVEDVVVAVLFAASAVSAALAAFGARVLQRVEKVALAVSLAAAAFFVRVTEFLGV